MGGHAGGQGDGVLTGGQSLALPRRHGRHGPRSEARYELPCARPAIPASSPDGFRRRALARSGPASARPITITGNAGCGLRAEGFAASPSCRWPRCKAGRTRITAELRAGLTVEAAVEGPPAWADGRPANVSVGPWRRPGTRLAQGSKAQERPLMTAHSFRLASLLLLFRAWADACGVNGAPDPPRPDKFFPRQFPRPRRPRPGAAKRRPRPSDAGAQYPPNTTTPISPFINELFSPNPGRPPLQPEGVRLRPAGLCAVEPPSIAYFQPAAHRAHQNLHSALRPARGHHLLIR